MHPLQTEGFHELSLVYFPDGARRDAYAQTRLETAQCTARPPVSRSHSERAEVHGRAKGRVPLPVAASAIKEKMKGLEDVANKWLKPYPNPGLRENVEVLLVAIAVAMGIRTFI